METPSTSIELLLEHREWVRRLAIALVGSQGADDLEQEVWLGALRRPARRLIDPQAWLATIARNAARKGHRGDSRRDARERAVAGPTSAPGVDELAQRAELERELSARVLALPEPYRSTLLLRWYEGLPPRAIAARTATAPDTVRSRLQRGQELLRRDLDRERGGREAWCALWIARFGIERREMLGTTAGAGALLATAAAVAALAVGSVSVARRLGQRRDQAPIAQRPPLEIREHAASSGLPSGAPAAERRPADGGVAPQGTGEVHAGAGVPHPDANASLAARVVDEHGRSLPNLRVELVEEPEPWIPGPEPAPAPRVLGMATSAADGTVELQRPSADWSGDLRVAGRVLFGAGRAESDGLVWLVFAPSGTVEGQVVDADGRPVPAARVSYSAGLTSQPAFPVALETEELPSAIQPTDAESRFRIDGVALVERAQITAYAEGFTPGSIDFDARGAPRDLRVVLRPSEPWATLSGRVRDFRGLAVREAHVHMGGRSATTGDDGRFELELRDSSASDTALLVSAQGLRALVLSDLGALLKDDRRSGVGLELTLEPSLPPIRGVVLDVDGEPCAGWNVALADGTPYDRVSVDAESTSAGRSRREVRTDREGRFELAGLLDRSYGVLAWDPRSLLQVHGGPVRPGGELDLRVPPDAFIETVTLHVVDPHGRSVPGVRVEACSPRFDKKPGFSSWTVLPRGSTDADGRAKLRDHPRGTDLLVSGDRVDPVRVPAGELAKGKTVRVVVDPWTRFRLEMPAGDAADRYRVLDEAGEVLELEYFGVDVTWGGKEVPLVDGAFPLCQVSERAATLVLCAGERELRRVRVSLAGGDVQVVRP